MSKSKRKHGGVWPLPTEKFDAEKHISEIWPDVLEKVGDMLPSPEPDTWVHLHGNEPHGLRELGHLVGEFLVYDMPPTIGAVVFEPAEYSPGVWVVSVAYWGPAVRLIGVMEILEGMRGEFEKRGVRFG